MIWLILTLASIILWGVTDILLKKSLNYTDSLAQYKTFVWIGLVSVPVCIIMAVCSDTLPDSIRVIANNPYLIPVNIFYVVAMFFGLLGAKHLDVSVVSPLENIDGAITAIILYLFFFFTGRSHITSSVGMIDIIGIVVITIGVILLGIQEQKLSRQENGFDEDKKKHRLGALALLFPIVYNLADAVSMVATGIMVSGETEFSIPDIDYIFFESFAFSLFALFVWLYILIAKKYVYNPFKKTELYCCGAAACDTLGTVGYINYRYRQVL